MGKSKRRLETLNDSTPRLSWATISHYAWRWRKPLMPIYVSLVVPVSVMLIRIWVAAAPANWWPGAWAAAAVLIAVSLAVLWVASLTKDHVLAGATVGVVSVLVMVLSIWPHLGVVWGLWFLGTPVGGAFWWFSATMRTFRALDRDEKTGQRLVERMRADATLESVARDRVAVEWHYSLGDDTRSSAFKVADVAHILNVKPERINIIPGHNPRDLVIRKLHKGPFTGAVPHPVLEDGATSTGGNWEPGTRTVLNRMPLGGTQDGGCSYVRVVSAEEADVGHIMLIGKTGTGKSVTAASIATAAIAAKDCLFAAADVPKNGLTYRPFAKAMPRVAATGEQLLADLEGLLRLAHHRNGQLVDRDLDKWPISADEPLVLYAIEELAVTLQTVDDDLADDITSALGALILVCRSAGIALLLVLQRPDFTALPTSIRAQIHSVIVHKLKSRGDLMKMWEGADIDPSTELPVKGMAYVGEGADDSDPVAQRAFWQTQKHKRFVGDVYADHQPTLTFTEAEMTGWGSANITAAKNTTPPQEDVVAAEPATATATPPVPATESVAVPQRPSQQRREMVDRKKDALSTMYSLIDDVASQALPDLPPGTPFVTAPVPTEDGDDTIDAELLHLLQQAGDDGLPIARLRNQVKAGSKRSVQRRLKALRDNGLVTVVGAGPACRWVIARERELVAA